MERIRGNRFLTFLNGLCESRYAVVHLTRYETERLMALGHPEIVMKDLRKGKMLAKSEIKQMFEMYDADLGNWVLEKNQVVFSAKRWYTWMRIYLLHPWYHKYLEIYDYIKSRISEPKKVDIFGFGTLKVKLDLLPEFYGLLREYVEGGGKE